MSNEELPEQPEDVVEAPIQEAPSDLDEVHQFLLHQLNLAKNRISELENQNFVLVREKRLIGIEYKKLKADYDTVKLLDVSKKK